MTDTVLIAHNLRSTHNVGSLLRTADGLGVGKIWLTGYSPYPQRENRENDDRLPHLAKKIHNQIAKTALGAEESTNWDTSTDIAAIISSLKKQGFVICALEQAEDSLPLPQFNPPDKVALIVGREVQGIEPEVLVLCDHILEIPMLGKKESFNVVQAAAMALYHFRFS